MVKKLARDHHSAALAQLASRIAVVVRYGGKHGADPFAKVKGLISDMIAKLEKELAALAKMQSEMDTIRQEEHADYSVAKAELEQGLGGVRKALDVLRSYYGGAALIQDDSKFNSFMQQPAP